MRDQRRVRGRATACAGLLLAGLSAASARLAAQGPADATAPGARDRTGSPATSRRTDDLGAASRDLVGLRERLAERGMRLEAFFVADVSRGYRSGETTRAEAFRNLFELSFTLETGRLLGWKGGKFFVDFQTQNGRHGSDALAGDIQGFSNLDSSGFTALYELWYEQTLLDGRLRMKLGKIDATNEFAFVENGGEFLNSSAGFSPTIVGFTTYPDPATGLVVFASPADWLYVGGGLFDGATQAGYPTGTRGPATLFGPPSALFLIAEAGLRRAAPDGRTSRLGLGLTHHTGTFALLNPGAAQSAPEDGATSIYLVLDRTRARKGRHRSDDEPGAAWFLQLGWTAESISLVDRHAGAGIEWNGPIAARPQDSLGLMATYVHLSRDARAAGEIVDNHETIYEIYYLLRLGSWLDLKPDLQYIVNPGGTGQADAVVGTLRLELSF